MDYPKSDPAARLHQDKFTDGDPVNGVLASRDSAKYQNMVFDELISLITGAGLEASENETGQVLKAVIALIESNAMIGVPIPWPSIIIPSNCRTMIGQAFDPVALPKLALVYPSNTIPDLRAEVIRGWDNGRGVDLGRVLLSAQGDAIRNITGSVSSFYSPLTPAGTGVLSSAAYGSSPAHVGVIGGSPGDNKSIALDASLQVPTALENRMRNVAFNIITRVA